MSAAVGEGPQVEHPARGRLGTDRSVSATPGRVLGPYDAMKAALVGGRSDQRPIEVVDARRMCARASSL